MLPIIVLEPAEPNPELGKLDNGAVKPVLEGCGAPILLAGFPKGMDPEESNVPVGFATDGVANEKEDTALGELLLTNLNKLSDGALDGEGPNVVPTGALVVLAAVVLVAVLPGGGPNLEANVGTDFSENDDAFLEAALFESGRLSPDCSNIEDCAPCRLVTAEFAENPLATKDVLFSEVDVGVEAGLEVAERD